MNKMLNIEEVKEYLKLDEDEIKILVEEEKLNAYKIGGEFIRFRQDQVNTLKQELKDALSDDKFSGKIYRFWSAHNFYIVTSAALALIIYFIFK